MRSAATAFAMTLAVVAQGACSSMHRAPDNPGKLAAARSAMQKAESLGSFTGIARTDLDAARYYLQQAEAATSRHGPRSEVDNLAYAAEQLATAAMARQEATLLQDGEARDREAKMALHRAETAEMEAERVRQLARPDR